MPDHITPTPDGQEQNNENHARDVKLLGNGRFGKWFENFWYHYKFQALATLFLAVVIIICVVQCARRPKETAFNICYAGNLNLGTSMSGDIPTQRAMKETLYPALSRILEEDDEEILEDSLNLYGYLVDDSSEFSTVLEQSRLNKQNLQDELNTANGYLFILSEDLFNSYAFSPSDRAPYMVKAEDYLPDGEHSIRLTEDGYGVYLHSTPLAEAAGFCDLPENTIIALRISFSIFQRDTAEKQKLYAGYEALFRAMLSGEF